jgi:hypothetical protein
MKSFVKPIVGSWFEFEHHNQVGAAYWNKSLPRFTAEQWRTLIRDMYDLGMEYLVMLSVAYDGKTYYPSTLLPQHNFECEDPLEAVLSEADNCGVKFFVSNDYWHDWQKVENAMKDEKIWLLRERGMEEIAAKYSHHKSFYGWYYPNESQINGILDDLSISYANRCSAIAHSLTPKAPTMIAPYGTQFFKYDEKYIRQLEMLDIDIIAYQDEVGVEKITPEETKKHYEALYLMHTKAARSRLWADIELFAFEGEIYRSPGIAAPFERVLRQLEAVSPYVEHILCYQYVGLMNRPGTSAFAGHRESTEKLYADYLKWLNNRY